MNKKEELKHFLEIISEKCGTDEYFILIKEWAENNYPSLLPIMEKIEEYQPKMPLVLAIDGRSCAGKSTTAEILSMIYQASIVHMDDFFLPQNLRTNERYAQAGGNVHYERFKDEVLPYIRSGEDFSYRKFNCQAMDYAGEVLVKKSPLIVVEGAYSLHPYLGDYYDLAIFMDIEPNAQLSRLKKRNTPEMLKKFQEKWILLEENYFNALEIRKNCQITIKAFD